MKIYFHLICLLPFSDNLVASYTDNNLSFPPNFLWGVSNSAYQFEGAWNQDGKSPNIWDYLLYKNPNFTIDGNNPYVSANSYNMIEEDISLLKTLNVKVFRMSLAWTRILPSGIGDTPNTLAVNHYKKLFKLLKQANIEPLVTLYHFDLPQKLSDYGGFLNVSIVDWFSNYARVCFKTFGDEVKHWSTFNEPYIWCWGAYSSGFLAPATTKPGFWEYECGHNLLKAHAKAWHIYDKEFRPTQKGTVSITYATDWYTPMTKSKDDVKSAERQIQFRLGWFAHPIYFGNYPIVMIKNIAKLSIEQGLNRSRLPSFTKQEIAFIRGTSDLFLLNTYRTYISNNTVTKSMKTPGFENDIRSSYQEDPTGTYWGARNLISWIRRNYRNPPIWITESGIFSNDSSLDDYFRVDFLKKFLNGIKDSIYMDKSNILGYTVWSISDSFDGVSGFSNRMGLSYIDFNSKNKTRIMRKSGYYFSKVCKTGCINDNCTTPKSYN